MKKEKRTGEAMIKKKPKVERRIKEIRSKRVKYMQKGHKSTQCGLGLRSKCQSIEYTVWVGTREKKEIERKPSTDFEILLMTDG
jgi:hypothetical protein